MVLKGESCCSVCVCYTIIEAASGEAALARPYRPALIMQV